MAAPAPTLFTVHAEHVLPEDLCASGSGTTRKSALSCEQRKKYHPAFVLPLDEQERVPTLTLCSLEGTLYAVSRYTLRRTSSFFATMFSLPQPKNPQPPFLEVYEPDTLLEPLLRSACGLETPAWDSLGLSALAEILFLAERWSMDGPTATLRRALTSAAFLAADPLHVYAIAVHFGWQEEMKLASSHTLSINILFPTSEQADTLAALPTPAVLALLRLHRTRLTSFQSQLDSPERFLAGNSAPFYCSSCARTPLDNSSWRGLKTRLVAALQQDLSGGAIAPGCYAGDGMHSWAETSACWEARCAKDGCGAKNYDRPGTIRQIQTCLEALPKVVEIDWPIEEDLS
ncbi:F-box domain-containing protein [Mycena chlorophos]|uniref:F-box domain-containing protein n=1 Tax=Mycena chlorophos TaxID=658473 RepID=A0A8H6WM48_MYCCL|nr:F-box domain-containing protein [Mycena chlorophos]